MSDFGSYTAQQKLISLVQADADYITLTSSKVILDVDPLQPEQADDFMVCFDIAGESDNIETLGLRNNGTSKEFYHIAVIIYVFDDTRSSVGKRNLVNYTNGLRSILKKYRVDPVAPATYNLLKFRDPATTYHVTDDFRKSITFVSLENRIRGL